MLHLVNENKMLRYKLFVIPQKIKQHLENTLSNYKGDATIDGYKRLNNLVDSKELTYNEMKRIKNFFDNYNGGIDNPTYLLNGGNVMKSWVDLELQKDNKTVKLNVPRTVHIALLQNEQDKEILVYHIKEDNTIELIPSSTTGGNLQFTVDHFSKFAIIAKIKTALASNEKDINTSAVQEEKKFTVIDTRGANSTPTNKPKTLPKTGETTNKSLTVIGLSLLALIGLLKRRKNN